MAFQSLELQLCLIVGQTPAYHLHDSSKCKTPWGRFGRWAVERHMLHSAFCAYQQEWAKRLSWRQRASPTVGTLFWGLPLLRSIHIENVFRGGWYGRGFPSGRSW